MTTHLSRRALLAAPLIAGGVAVAAAADRALPWLRDPNVLAESVRPASEPRARLRFVSRPDLSPPGLSIRRTSTFAAVAGPRQPSYIFLSPKAPGVNEIPGGAQSGIAIIDLNGHLVWFRPRPSIYHNMFNFRCQMLGKVPVLTWFEGRLGPGYGLGGNYPVMDSTYTVRHRVRAVGRLSDLHEFRLTPQHTALLTAYELSPRLIIGHAQEVDVSSNHLLFDWPCYPTIHPSESYVPGAYDYFHLNSVDLWPGSERDLLISSRNCCAVYLIRRSTKTVRWRLHGKRSSFHLAPGTAFWYQHDARALSDGSGVSLFDDASQQPPNVSPEKQSWGKVISLDERTMRATLRHQFRHATSRVDAASEGNVQLLANGAHMVGFGSTSYLAEYAPSGDSLTPQQILDGRLPSGITSYRAFMGDWVGEPPLDELAFVVRRSSGPGVFDAFVSWNGATKVDTWRISAGTARSPLTAVKRVPKAGFETAVRIVSDGASHFQASAFDREGRLLGSSRVVSTS